MGSGICTGLERYYLFPMKEMSGNDFEEYAILHRWQCIIKLLIKFVNVLLKNYREKREKSGCYKRSLGFGARQSQAQILPFYLLYDLEPVT